MGEKVNKTNKTKLLPATNRAASYAIKIGVRKQEILLNRREVHDVKRDHNEGEERRGEYDNMI